MDLSTNYLGLRLRNPLVASAGPIAQTVTGIKSLADGGVGAVVLYSLFEEQVRAADAYAVELMEVNSEANPEARGYLPEVPGSEESMVPAQYLSLLERASSEVDVPIIASLNGATMGGWTSFAKELEEAGAAAIELNIYFVPGDIHTPGSEVEQRHIDIIHAVKDAVTIPIAVKMSSAFSSVGHMAMRMVEAGADGLVMFNRFLQPDIDIEAMKVQSGFVLSNPDEGRLPRTWIASLRGHLGASLAATSGVETSDDVVKYLLSGADVVMTTASLVRHGAGYASVLLKGLEEWAQRRGYQHLDDFRGLLAVPAHTDGDLYARTGYLAALEKAKLTYGSLTN